MGIAAGMKMILGLAEDEQKQSAMDVYLQQLKMTQAIQSNQAAMQQAPAKSLMTSSKLDDLYLRMQQSQAEYQRMIWEEQQRIHKINSAWQWVEHEARKMHRELLDELIARL